MRELEVGIRIRVEEGIQFIGIDEVNQLIRAGHRVTGVEAGGVIMDKLGEDEEYVRLTLAGCTIKVLLDDGPDESRAGTRPSPAPGPS